MRHVIIGGFFIDIQIWDFSRQKLKYQLQISSSLGRILNSTPGVDGEVHLSSYYEQLTEEIKLINRKVLTFLQLTGLDSLINSNLGNISDAEWGFFSNLQLCISEYSSQIKTFVYDF